MGTSSGRGPPSMPHANRPVVRRYLLTCALSLAFSQVGAAQTPAGRIAGMITGVDTGRALAGARVVVVGTRRSAVTGTDGRYAISDVAPGTYRLRVLSLGFAPRTVEGVVAADSGTTVVDIHLSQQPTLLDEVVVTGYGITSRRDLTGAVASISGGDLTPKAAPPLTLSNALQGKAAGVLVTTNSGVPGAGASVRVRGTNSITNSEPLYVIDGIPAAQGTRSTDPTLNPLNSIDPTAIEAIHVLKDASATAIYGARGANGVVMVTTKSGEAFEGRTIVESSFGQQTISKRLGVLSGPEYMRLRNEAYVNAGRVAPYTDAQIDAAASYDYPSMIVDRAPQESHGVTFTGGDARTRLLVSGNSMTQRGIIVNSDFRRTSARLNLIRDMSEKFRLNANLSGVRSQQGLNETDGAGIGANSTGILAAMNFDPTVAPRNTAGSWNLLTALGEQLQNPVANAIEIRNPRRVLRLLGSMSGEYALTNALRLRSTFGTNAIAERTPKYRPSSSPAGKSSQGWASVYSAHGNEVTNESTIDYRSTPLGHELSFLGGFSMQTSSFEDEYAEAQGFPDDGFSFNNLGAGKTRSGIASNAVDWTVLSFLGRATYNISDRYLVTLTARRDGSSRFAVNNKWAFFPSAAFAWRALDDLKFRVSYGVTGNQAISEYQSLARLSPVFVPVGVGNEAVTMAPFGRAPNPDLKWETQRQLNTGVDMAFRDNRLLVSVDGYETRTHGLLLDVALPRSSGFSSQFQNVGSLRNRGVELTVSAISTLREQLFWRSTFNVAANRNTVLDLGGREFIEPSGERYFRFLGGTSSHITMVGEPLGAFYGYQVNGIFQQGDVCTLSTPRIGLDCVPGEYNIADANGDGLIDRNDRVILGSAEPNVFGGLTNNLGYGRWTLDASLVFSQGNKVANVGRAWTELATAFLNESDRVLDRWTPTNTSARVPRANNARPRLLYSTLVEDASFLRLQTLTLGFKLPTRGLMSAYDARLYVTGQNLFVLTRYTGFDPEVNSLGGDPQEPGVDVGAYPRARTWNVGLNVAF
jgi:TonB-linked SusC/RagA family outer membrane protein